MARTVVLCLCIAAGAVSPVAQSATFLALTPGFPLWAYGYKTPPAAPQDWSGRCPGSRPRDCDRPGGMPADTTGAKLTIPGSGEYFTIAISRPRRRARRRSTTPRCRSSRGFV